MRNLVQLWVVGNLNGTVEPAEQLDTFMARRDAEQAEAELVRDERDPDLTAQEYRAEETDRGRRRARL
jgi:hypothetical protein